MRALANRKKQNNAKRLCSVHHGAQLTKDHQGGETTPPPRSVLPILQILLLKPEDCNHIVDYGGFTGQWFAVWTRDGSQLEV